MAGESVHDNGVTMEALGLIHDPLKLQRAIEEASQRIPLNLGLDDELDPETSEPQQIITDPIGEDIDFETQARAVELGGGVLFMSL